MTQQNKRTNVEGIGIGDIVTYKMRYVQRPTHPDKLWKAIVVKVYPGTVWTRDCLYVHSIEEGYKDCGEYVYPEQLVLIEKQEAEDKN